MLEVALSNKSPSRADSRRPVVPCGERKPDYVGFRIPGTRSRREVGYADLENRAAHKTAGRMRKVHIESTARRQIEKPSETHARANPQLAPVGERAVSAVGNLPRRVEHENTSPIRVASGLARSSVSESTGSKYWATCRLRQDSRAV